ncbi:MAG: sodium-independent anion transporter, partial [Desulfobulbaceae bacterium A2]
LMGLLAFAIMYILKRTAPRIPNVLVAVVVTTSISWLTGFEHNQQVALSAIRSDNALTLVRQFNEATAAIAPLAEERSALGKKLEAVKKTHEHIAVLTLEHETNLLNARMEEMKSAAAVAREQLRRLKLVRVADDPSTPGQFFLRDEAVGHKDDGRTWRFRVGNTVLKEDKVPLIGGGAVVGVVPSGLPTPSLPKIDVGVMMYLLPYAVIISLLGFMEAVSIAKAMAAKTGQRLDANQELLGQGIANALGALTQSFPTSGSFSRSAVNLQAGAVSGFSSVFTSITVVIVLLLFTPLLYHLPQSVLAAVIMMAVIGLINVSGFVHAWKAQWYDGAISVISFIATLAFAPHLDKGIMIGVGLSLVVFLYKSMRPTIASLSRTLDKSMGDAAIHGLKECQYMAVVRFDGPLFYANASYLEERVGQIRLEKKHLRHVVLVCNGISDMDASGEEALSFLVDRLRSAGIEISFSGINEAVMAVLRRTHLLEKIGEENIFPTREQAVCAMHGKAHRGIEEPDCPLFSVCRLT